jgi:Asp-tRNA(Asn)/Glu-tRNA(Gln) amidotransferase A subunit family amidase
VEDAARVFQVIVGEDPNDPVTAAAREHPKVDYLASIDRNGLKGARIGLLRQAYERDSLDPEIASIFMNAVEELRRAGATIVDPVTVESVQRGGGRGGGGCQGFKYDLNRFLAAEGDRVPVKSLADVLKSRGYHPSVQLRLENADKGAENGPDSPACEADRAYREQVRKAVLNAMEKDKLDAFVYPTWSNVPRLIGDLNTPAGDNSQFYSPTTGFPAINVPMGFSRNGTLPAGMTIFGAAWSEEKLIRFAYAYEQATKHRKPPPAL